MLETITPSYALSKVKNENGAIRILTLRDAFLTKNPINESAMNNKRLLISAAFHFVPPVEKDIVKNITS